jgi:hypothetical protein
MALTDAQVRRKLEQLVKISSELHEEARRRWSHPEAMLFFESEGTFYMMAGDCDGSCAKRQKFIRFQSRGTTSMGAGAW